MWLITLVPNSQFIAHKVDGSGQVFVASNHGIYFADLIETGSLFNTNAGIVNNNYKYFSHDYSKALARMTQGLYGDQTQKTSST